MPSTAGADVEAGREGQFPPEAFEPFAVRAGCGESVAIRSEWGEAVEVGADVGRAGERRSRGTGNAQSVRPAVPRVACRRGGRRPRWCESRRIDGQLGHVHLGEPFDEFDFERTAFRAGHSDVPVADLRERFKRIQNVIFGKAAGRERDRFGGLAFEGEGERSFPSIFEVESLDLVVDRAGEVFEVAVAHLSGSRGVDVARQRRGGRADSRHAAGRHIGRRKRCEDRNFVSAFVGCEYQVTGGGAANPAPSARFPAPKVSEGLHPPGAGIGPVPPGLQFAAGNSSI